MQTFSPDIITIVSTNQIGTTSSLILVAGRYWDQVLLKLEKHNYLVKIY